MDSDPKITCKYEYAMTCGKPVHTWSAVFGLGGVHLHIHDSGKNAKYGRYHGGIEIHRRTPPEHCRFDAPDHDNCWLIKGPCWHDGSSLQVDEFWLPFWLTSPHDHDRMFAAISKQLLDWFADDMGDGDDE